MCGLDDIRILQINHINGNGWKDREKYHGNQAQFYLDIIKNKCLISEYDIRCANHNILYEYEQDGIQRK